jgi:phosphate transport system permease protein
MFAVPDSFRYLFIASTVICACSVLFILGFIIYTAAPVLGQQGIGFITGTTWDYSTHQYGIGIFLAGTIVLTLVTIAIAFPIGLAASVFLAEWAPVWLDRTMSSLIELLVGIPSVIFGLFGYFVLKEYFHDVVNPAIGSVLGFIPLFHYSGQGGQGIFLASFVLAIMVLPTIVALSHDAMKGVPDDYREASIALGATKWETIKHIVLPAALPGILTGFILAAMRAMGETMAVVMLIGNGMAIPHSIFDSGYAMTSKILGDISYYIVYDEPKSALFGIAAVLLLMEILFVVVFRVVSERFKHRV